MKRFSGVTLLGALYFTGCGYQFGYRAPAGVRRVAVPVFRNESFPLRREIEYELTRAVRQEIKKRTDLSIVGEEGADLVIRGVVRQFQEVPLAEGRFDELAESSIFVTVDVQLEDGRTGEVILRRPVSDSADFSLIRGQDLRLARRRAIDQIAEEILLLMEDWGPDVAPETEPVGS